MNPDAAWWLQFLVVNASWLLLALGAGVVLFRSLHQIGPTEVGLVNKRFSISGLRSSDPIASHGEAGYQSSLLRPGLRFKLWPLFTVRRYPWVQIPVGQIGIVISQIGGPIPVGAKSALYRQQHGDYTDIEAFLANGGQKGVQRPVLRPGTVAPIHPVAFLVLTADCLYGLPISEEVAGNHRDLLRQLSLEPAQLYVTRIEPQEHDGKVVDIVGIVTTGEGGPLPSTDIAGRIGGFADIVELEAQRADRNLVVERVLASKNGLHDNYQDYQAFLDNGGCMGLQHDPLLYGVYNLNPYLVHVERVIMRVIDQGQVGVVKAYVGLPTEDTSGENFKFGSLVNPGHRGIWNEPLRTGKYALNPRCYQIEVVPTSILTLNWADATSKAHDLDGQLSQIDAKSMEGFQFKLDLQVQIHVPDSKAPRVISAVGNMRNLVNEVLQASVGNHFRNKLQSMPAIKFIETRHDVQTQADTLIRSKLAEYDVETPGVYIQDVVLPDELVKVLRAREVAKQSIETLEQERLSQSKRVEMERAKGLADRQSALSSSEVDISIRENNAKARKLEAAGEAAYVREVGSAEGEKIRATTVAQADGVRAEGLARAEGYQAQVAALGQGATALVNAIDGLAGVKTRFVPDILVTGGGGTLDAFGGVAMEFLRGLAKPGATPPAPTEVAVNGRSAKV